MKTKNEGERGKYDKFTKNGTRTLLLFKTMSKVRTPNSDFSLSPGKKGTECAVIEKIYDDNGKVRILLIIFLSSKQKGYDTIFMVLSF